MNASADVPARNTMLGITYDEVFRRDIENKCGQLGAGWDYKSKFLELDENTLRTARRSLNVFVSGHCNSSHCVNKGSSISRRRPLTIKGKVMARAPIIKVKDLTTMQKRTPGSRHRGGSRGPTKRMMSRVRARSAVSVIA